MLAEAVEFERMDITVWRSRSRPCKLHLRIIPWIMLQGLNSRERTNTGHIAPNRCFCRTRNFSKADS